MTITIKKLSNNLYTATATPPHVKEEWSTSHPLSREDLYKALVERGAHPVDVSDAISAEDPFEARLTAQRYPKLREFALREQIPNLMHEPIQAISMEWNVGSERTATALAFADGTASLYFSNGGGFIGGSQRYSSIREAAREAIRLANSLVPLFETTATIDLPKGSDVFFYLNTKAGPRVAKSTDSKLEAGTDPLSPLGAAMQKIIAEYRLKYPLSA